MMRLLLWAAAVTTACCIQPRDRKPNHYPSWRASNDTPTVTVKNGTLQGVFSKEYNQDFFLGVPFAQPPVGNLRFRAARSLNTSWTGTKAATKYSPECVGYGSDDWPYEVSEDCLYLNVIRPAGVQDTSRLPIALWIYGGAYYMGGAPDQRYNLSFFVENSVQIGKPVIGVSINYRLSAWGFLASKEVQGSGDLNLGLRDQRLALHWVRENIKAFGGDPDKVTIWGESAGASSVGFQLTAFGGQDDKLFRGAIMESGSPVLFSPFNSTGGLQPAYDTIVSRVNCAGMIDTLQCLRGVPFAQLNAAINSTNNSLTTWMPIVDGNFIRKYTSIQLQDGDFVKVPVLIGANTDEGTSFAIRGVYNVSDLANALVVRGISPAFVDVILSVYPDDPSQGIPATLPPDVSLPANFGAQWRRGAAIMGDVIMIANRRLTCERWAQYGATAYSYRFNVTPAGVPAYIGAAHFQEVAWVFKNYNGVGYQGVNPFANATQASKDLSTLMSSSWASFVYDLDPNSYRANSSAIAKWPVYSLTAPQNIVFDINATYVEPDTFRKDGIALFNSVDIAFPR